MDINQFAAKYGKGQGANSASNTLDSFAAKYGNGGGSKIWAEKQTVTTTPSPTPTPTATVSKKKVVVNPQQPLSTPVSINQPKIDLNLTTDQSGNVVQKEKVSPILPDKYGETTISAPAKQTFWSSLKNKIREIITPTDVVKDQVNYNLQKKVASDLGVKQNEIPLDYIQKNRDAITKELGIRNQPTTGEMVSAAFQLALIAGIVENPVSTAIGIAGFQGTSELISAGVSAIQGEKYKPLEGKGLSDLLPADINPTIKGGVDLLQFALQAKAYQTLKTKAPKIAESLTKDITTKYNLPETISVDKDVVRKFYVNDKSLDPKIRQTLIDLDIPQTQLRKAVTDGVTIEVPWQKVVTVTDKPYWAKVKNIFKIQVSPEFSTITNLDKPITTTKISGALPAGGEMMTPPVVSQVTEKPQVVAEKEKLTKIVEMVKPIVESGNIENINKLKARVADQPEVAKILDKVIAEVSQTETKIETKTEVDPKIVEEAKNVIDFKSGDTVKDIYTETEYKIVANDGVGGVGKLENLSTGKVENWNSNNNKRFISVVEKTVTKVEPTTKIKKETTVTKIEPKIETTKSEKLVLTTSKAKEFNEFIEEANKAGVSKTLKNPNWSRKGEITYYRPVIGKNELNILIKNSPEFRANPTLTVVQDGDDKVLEFSGKKVQVKIFPKALQINEEKLEIGDKIEVDVKSLKKSPKVNQMRVEKDGEVYGYNPKNIDTKEPTSPKTEKELNKLVRQSEIARNLSEKLGVPIRRGRFRHGGAIGLYKSGQKIARYKSGGLPTIFHEAAGHYIDDVFKFSESINKKEREALMVEYGYSYKGQVRKQQKEAFAEFMRFILTGQEAKAKSLAPEFYELYSKRIETMPDIKEVIDTAARDYQRWKDQPAVAKILSQISFGKQRKDSLVDRATAGIHELYTLALDDLHPLDEFSKLAQKNIGNIDATKDPYILARNLRGWVGKAELFLNSGTFEKKFWSKNEKGKTVMKFTGKPYSEIMKPVEKLNALNDFRVYLIAQRVVNDLAPLGKKSGITEADAKVALEELNKKYPMFEEIATQRREYKDALLKYANQNGLIGDEALAKLKEVNKYHVPFYRVMEETGTKFLGKSKMGGNISSPIKKFKGSDREIIDPFESDIKDTYAIINAAERNNIGVAMAKLAAKNYELGRLFERVDTKMTPVKVNAGEVIKKAFQGTDVDLSSLSDYEEELMVTLFRPTQDRGANMLNVNMGDKQLTYQVDPSLFKAIQGLNAEDVGILMKLLAIPAKLLRAGATLTPDFSVRNPLRDQFSALVYSKYGFVPGLDLVKGMFELLRKKDVYNLFKAGGGEHSMMVSLDRELLQKSFKEILRSKGAATIDYVKNPIKLLQVLSELGEMGTRLGEMRNALNKGQNPIQSAFDSREITLDFARIGAKMKATNMIIAFYNANLQGTDKLIRSFKKKPFRTLFKILLGITLPSILLYFANKDDERWKEIPAWQKDLFWIILTPKHIIRIPKPFEMGILFGSVPERILEYIDTKDPYAFDQLKKDVAGGFTPGFIPTALLPIVENITNYSFFKERPIVSQGEQNLPPEQQAGTYTSETAKIIGEALGYSPSKVDNLIQGYTGGLGTYTTAILDKILLGTGISSKPTPPAKSIEDYPIVKAFMIRKPIGSGSESVNRIYDLYGKNTPKLNYVKKLIKSGDTEKAKDYIKKHPEVADALPINSMVSTFGDLNKIVGEIRQSKTLTAEEKRDKINKIGELQTDMASKLLEEINKNKGDDKKLINFNIFKVKPAIAAENDNDTRIAIFKNADGEEVTVAPVNKTITPELMEKKRDVIQKIVNVAEAYDVDKGLMVDLAYAENSFDVDVKGTNVKDKEGKKASTATGFYQFTDGTWNKEIITKYADKIGIPKDAKRTDVDANMRAAAWAIKNGYLRWWVNPDNKKKFLNNTPAKILKKYGVKNL